MQFDYSIKRIAGADPIVPLALAKKNSNIEDDDQDDLLLLKLRGAIAAVENYTERIYQAKRLVLSARAFAKNMAFPITSVQEITRVSYSNTLGLRQDLPVDSYQFYSYQNGTIQGLQLRSDTPIGVDLKAPFPIQIEGLIGESELPDAVVSAVLLLFSERELFRENRPQKITDTAAIHLLRPYRKY